MTDSFGRTIDYMRVSVTDRCNLRCRYCMPDGIEKIPMSALLTYEEILEVVRAAAGCGISRIKVTGGEPLVRLGVTSLIREMKEVPGIRQVTMTTNGVILAEHMEALIEAGLDSVNISLDTMDPAKFRMITGFDELPRVLEGIRAAVDSGITTRINAVLQEGINSGEWRRILLLAKDLPLDVRFIEMMPIGCGRSVRGVSNETLLGKIREAFPSLEEDPLYRGNGPAVYYRIDGFRGHVGMISAIHGKFCADCNRVRLTSTGKIKPCLAYGNAVDLRPVLRSGDSEEERRGKLENAIRDAIAEKPAAHCFETPEKVTEIKKMAQIGG